MRLYSIKPFVARFIGDSDFVNALAVAVLSFSQSSSADEVMVARFLPLFLDAAASQFKLKKYSSIDKVSAYRYPSSSWPDCSNSWERGERDASVIVDLHQHLVRWDKEKASELLRQIQAQTQHIDEYELNRLVVPLLEQMMGIINQCPLDACQFYQSMMTTYITRNVKPEPKKPVDWSQPGEMTDCGQPHCSICLPVKEFMLHPVEEQRKFKFTDYDSLNHVQDLLSSRCYLSVDCYSSEFRQLSVMKGSSQCRIEHEKWETRAKTALKNFKRFVPQDDLKRCLGDKYDAIVGLKMLMLPEEDGDLTVLNIDSDDESSVMVFR
jgi:hypothetical protein